MRHDKRGVRMAQGDLFLNWYGYEVTCDEYEICDESMAWVFDWDLPIPEGVEESYENKTGKSCVYWCPESSSDEIGNPSRDCLPRSRDYTTNGYTESFCKWLEKKIFAAVCVKNIRDKIGIWKSINEVVG